MLNHWRLFLMRVMWQTAENKRPRACQQTVPATNDITDAANPRNLENFSGFWRRQLTFVAAALVCQWLCGDKGEDGDYYPWKLSLQLQGPVVSFSSLFHARICQKVFCIRLKSDYILALSFIVSIRIQKSVIVGLREQLHPQSAVDLYVLLFNNGSATICSTASTLCVRVTLCNLSISH